MIEILLITGVLLLLVAMVVYRLVPRCPECGSMTVTIQWPGERIWVCENCQTVFRTR